MKKFSVLVLCMLVFVGLSFADNSSSSVSTTRWSLGYAKVNFDVAKNREQLDSVASRFWFDDNLGMDVSLGFKTGDSTSAILLSAKMIGNIIKVNKLNIYWLGGLAIGSYDPKEDGVKSFTVFRVQGGVGAEYFLLPCLSLLTEVGLQFTSANGDQNFNDFGVYADWLPQAGIRFYFN